MKITIALITLAGTLITSIIGGYVALEIHEPAPIPKFACNSDEEPVHEIAFAPGNGPPERLHGPAFSHEEGTHYRYHDWAPAGFRIMIDALSRDYVGVTATPIRSEGDKFQISGETLPIGSIKPREFGARAVPNGRLLVYIEQVDPGQWATMHLQLCRKKS